MNRLLRRRWALPLVALVASTALWGAASGPSHRADARVKPPDRAAASRARTADATPPKANIVFILTDDLSMDLLPYMPHVLAIEQQGLSFSDYFVSDSLCCPSRSSIFTGS